MADFNRNGWPESAFGRGDGLLASLSNGSELAESRDPGKAAALANTFVEELGTKSVQLNLTKAGIERVFLEKRLALVKGDLQRAEDTLRSFQEINKVIRVDSQSAAAIEGIAKVKAEIVSKEVQLASLKSYQTDESPNVKMLQAAVGRLRSQLGGLMGKGAGSDGIPSLGAVPHLGIEYLRRMRELKTQEAIFEQLTRQYEIAKLTEAKDSSALQVLDDAAVPIKPSRPKRSLIIILATGVGFFVAVFLALGRELAARMPPDDRARVEEIKGMLTWKKEN